MKRAFFILIMMVIAIGGHAQFTQDNSILRKVISGYELNSDGYYHKITNKLVSHVTGIEGSYAYDKTAQNLYVITPYSNIVITLTKDNAKIFKKNKAIPQLSDEELDVEIQRQTKLLDEKFLALNEARAKHIQDSIAKAISDYIAAEKQIAKLKKERSDYMNAHNWHWTPTGDIPLYCTSCESYISEDSLLTIGIANDTIYYFTSKEGKLGQSYLEGHKSQLEKRLKEHKPLRYHYEIFKDSLTKDSVDYDYVTTALSYSYFGEYISYLKKRAPYGFFTNWGWDSEYSCISFHFNYLNTSTQTIKYIDVYFRVTNDVGDVRKTGHFQGTGPLGEFESATWQWDTSSYYVAGDASKMSITKVILTYMNGAKKVLTGNLIVVD